MSDIKTLGDEPAYPIIRTKEKDSTIWDNTSYAEISSSGGLSKREAFAIAAMQSLARDCSPDYSKGSCDQALAQRAVILADALIAELNKPTTKI